MLDHDKKQKVAVWAITPKGAELAQKIAENLLDTELYLSANLKESDVSCNRFKKLSNILPRVFNEYRGHIFIMSTGIVVRVTAPLLAHKTVDPAVVVVDEMGQHAISLLSGHIGGANRLATDVAGGIGAVPVITTATDVNKAPAIDLLAVEKGLFIENPEAIKGVNMAFLTGEAVVLHDPFGFLSGSVPGTCRPVRLGTAGEHPGSDTEFNPEENPAVYIDDIRADLPSNVLILRPGSLVAGMGCNRDTSMAEMKSFLHVVLDKFDLSPDSLHCIATVDIKSDETGLLALSKDLELPLKFYDREELNRVENIETPSKMVEKHIGVKSVCEAAAILASNRGNLIVPKQSTQNVTVAIARKSFTL
ncbi:MAG: cobalt-precorrin 5A hydrolase [Deltaproteobacteria bacterium]|nr:cobalt-precorrin 5A hydrolase [Deltaproteobacteria bacterium]